MSNVESFVCKVGKMAFIRLNNMKVPVTKNQIIELGMLPSDISLTYSINEDINGNGRTYRFTMDKSKCTIKYTGGDDLPSNNMPTIMATVIIFCDK